MRKFENLNDVMKELTFLKNASSGYDGYNDSLDAIAGVLELFGVKWQYEYDNKKWIAKLL